LAARALCASTVAALVALVCGCQFSIRGSGPAGNDPTLPPLAAQDGFSSIDLASRLDMTTAPPAVVDLASTPRDLSSPLPDKVGDACNGQCASGLTCMTWVAAGYCSRTCSDAAECPNGSSCVAVGNDKGPQYCLLDEDSGCTRSDLRCIDCGAKVCGPSSFCDAC